MKNKIQAKRFFSSPNILLLTAWNQYILFCLKGNDNKNMATNNAQMGWWCENIAPIEAKCQLFCGHFETIHSLCSSTSNDILLQIWCYCSGNCTIQFETILRSCYADLIHSLIPKRIPISDICDIDPYANATNTHIRKNHAFRLEILVL